MNGYCLLCGKCAKRGDVALESTAFISHGNYGSTVWDPMSDREWLEIWICDECLKSKAREGFVAHGRDGRDEFAKFSYTRFTPEGE